MAAGELIHLASLRTLRGLRLEGSNVAPGEPRALEAYLLARVGNFLRPHVALSHCIFDHGWFLCHGPATSSDVAQFMAITGCEEVRVPERTHKSRA